MFERLTERARQIVVLAQEEARTLKHGYIGTEHLLLGMLREQEGVAARALESFHITVERVRGEVVRIVGVGNTTSPGQLPFTPEARRALELASEQPRELGQSELGQNYIGTEHLLLGLISLGEGVATRILVDCNAQPDRVRAEVIRLLSRPDARAEQRSRNAPAPGPNGFEEWIRVGSGAGVRRLMMVAAARALDDGREAVQPRDVLLALTRDGQIGPVLAEFGVDDAAVQRALERHPPPDASTAS